MYKLSSNDTLLKINIAYGETFPKIFINKKKNDTLKQLKNKIDDVYYQSNWDKFKKLTNPYEFIHISKRKNNKNNSIAKYNPFSRSYFKLWEMLIEFNLINDLNHTNINVAHIAEGPGGFMEALVQYRKKYTNKLKDNIYGITLKSIKREIPGWIKANEFIKQNNIHISYGKDNTGNIYNIDNILEFTKEIGDNKCDLVTSDGGFDFSVDFNHQEQQAYRLIFCEIVIGISIQKVGGHQVIKVFDIYSKLTVKLLYLLSVIYKEVYIYKPITSRPANSEKYIIAKYFKGIDTNYLKQLYGIVRLWKSIEDNNYFITDLFEDNLSDSFIKSIEEYNIQNIEKQTRCIEKTLNLILNKPTARDYNNIIKSQLQHAIEWCNKYNVSINYESKYFLK